METGQTVNLLLRTARIVTWTAHQLLPLKLTRWKQRTENPQGLDRYQGEAPINLCVAELGLVPRLGRGDAGSSPATETNT